jgi:hypothetical protein
VASGLTVLACLAATAGSAQNAAPVPAKAQGLTDAERARRLVEIEQLKKDAVNLASTCKLDEAVAETRKLLALQREVWGELHEEVVVCLGYLARLQEFREDWEGARDALNQVLMIRRRQPGPGEWRVADAQRALGDLDRRAAMAVEQRRRLRRADGPRPATPPGAHLRPAMRAGWSSLSIAWAVPPENAKKRPRQS